MEPELSESTASETPKDLSNRIILSIQKDETVYLGGSKIEEGKLKARFLEMQELYPEITLRIRAD